MMSKSAGTMNCHSCVGNVIIIEVLALFPYLKDPNSDNCSTDPLPPVNVTGHVTNDLDLLVTVGISWDYPQYSVADTIEITLAEDDDSSVNCTTPLYTFKLPFGKCRLLFCVRYSGRLAKVSLFHSLNFRNVFN